MSQQACKKHVRFAKQPWQGHSYKILTALEVWAAEMDYKICVLETGKNNPKPLDFIKRMVIKSSKIMGNIKGVQNSIYFEKVI